MKIQSKIFAVKSVPIDGEDFFVSSKIKIELFNIPMVYVVANHWIWSLLWLYGWSFYDYYVELRFLKVFESNRMVASAERKNLYNDENVLFIHTEMQANCNESSDAHVFISHFILHEMNESLFTLYVYVYVWCAVACQSNALTPNCKDTSANHVTNDRKK